MSDLQPVWRCKCGHWEVRHERAVNAIPDCIYCCACGKCPPGQTGARDRFGRFRISHHRKPVRMWEAVRKERPGDLPES